MLEGTCAEFMMVGINGPNFSATARYLHSLHLSKKYLSLLHGELAMLGTILLIILILILLGSFPAWPHSRSWGYGPSGGIGTILIIVVILVLMGRI